MILGIRYDESHKVIWTQSKGRHQQILAVIRSPSLYFTYPIHIFIVWGILNWPLLFLLSIPFRNEWELSLHWFLFSDNNAVQSLIKIMEHGRKWIKNHQWMGQWANEKSEFLTCVLKFNWGENLDVGRKSLGQVQQLKSYLKFHLKELNFPQKLKLSIIKCQNKVNFLWFCLF